MQSATELFLSTETSIEIACVDGAEPSARWMEIAHTGIVRPALILIAGESATFVAPLMISVGSRLALRYGAAHGDLSSDGAGLAAELVDTAGLQHPLVLLSIPAGPRGMVPREALIDLTPWAGAEYRLCLRCDPGFANDPRADWLAVFDLAVGSDERLSTLRALAFRKQRAENEMAHFDSVYEHAMYASGTRNGDRPAESCLPFSNVMRHVRAARTDTIAAGIVHAPPDGLEPMPSNAYEYAHRLLDAALSATAPNFQQRLIERCKPIVLDGGDAPLRVLSLCSGAARFEAQFANAVGPRAVWTLLDISEALLQEAARNFPEGVVPTLIAVDLNEIEDFDQRFDIVLCVSGLHHIVELERVIGFIGQTLAEGGEFWSIGEAIGRSGNRLFDTDYHVANAFFRQMPEHLRRNAVSNVVDVDLPNTDYSDATFEGIRSHEIERVLAQHLEPLQAYRRNCFLWRLVNLAYADNYDLKRGADIAWIQRAVDAELAHFRRGGSPAELHGIYRKRTL